MIVEDPIIAEFHRSMVAFKSYNPRAGNRTMPMLEPHGYVRTIERLVTTRTPSLGFTTLVENGQQELTLEAIVLRHPMMFSAEARESAGARLAPHIPQAA